MNLWSLTEEVVAEMASLRRLVEGQELTDKPAYAVQTSVGSLHKKGVM